MDIYAMLSDRDVELVRDMAKDHWHPNHEHCAKQLCVLVEIYHEVMKSLVENHLRKESHIK